jgi:hypothetical protein
VKKMIKRILIIGFFAISLVIALTGCSGSGLKTVNPLLPENQIVAATNTTDTDNIEDESLNGQDDSQEVVKVEEADGEVEEIEPANEQDQENNLPNGGYQDQDNIDVDHQFEGVE